MTKLSWPPGKLDVCFINPSTISMYSNWKVKYLSYDKISSLFKTHLIITAKINLKMVEQLNLQPNVDFPFKIGQVFMEFAVTGIVVSFFRGDPG